MNRWLLRAATALALLSAVQAEAQTVSGTVLLPTVTGTAVAREAHNRGVPEGLFEVFFEVTQPGCFTLVARNPTAGFPDFDIFFYDIHGLPVGNQDEFTVFGNEAGRMPDGTRFALVTMPSGVRGGFQFDSAPCI